MKEIICLLLLLMVGLSVAVMTVDEIRTNRKLREWCDKNKE